MEENALQMMINGFQMAGQNARANSEQFTLGQLIEAFEEFAKKYPDKQIKDFDPHSYRGYYVDLALDQTRRFAGKIELITAKDALQKLKNCMGEQFEGYKGGYYQMGRNTPVWHAQWGSVGMKIIGFNTDIGMFLLKEDDD